MADPRQFAAEILVARRLFFEGVESVASRDDIRVRTGLLRADLAVESLLKTALRFYGKEPRDGSKFHELLGDVKATFPANGPRLDYLRPKVDPLRSMRNAVMHDGRAQVPEEAQKEVERERDAVTRLVRDVFGFDFTNLHLGEFVRSPLLRFLLDEAEQRFVAGKYLEALALAGAVYRSLLGVWEAYVSRLFGLGNYRPRHQDQEEQKARLHELTSAVSAGVHLPSLKRFREITKGCVAFVRVSGKLDTTISRSEEPAPEDARFALDFAGGLVLQIEPRFGDELPTGLLNGSS